MKELTPGIVRQLPAKAAEVHGVSIAPPQVVRVEVEKLVKAPTAGWRFVPMRDENNLIVEIIATPIEA